MTEQSSSVFRTLIDSYSTKATAWPTDCISIKAVPREQFVKVHSQVPFVLEKWGLDVNSVVQNTKDWVCQYYSEAVESYYGDGYHNPVKVLLLEKNGIYVYLQISPGIVKSISVVTVLFAKEREVEAKKLMDSFKPYQEEKVPRIHYLVTNGTSLEFQETIIPKSELHLDYYNDGFAEFNANMEKFLTHWEKAGLAILHGPPGTGKTSYLRYLASNYSNVTYIPPSLTSEIGSPNFLGFLSKHPKRVYVIEDAENVIISDGMTRTSALQNLLNATDGLMGDIINSKFVLTFNSDITNVDKALLRSGRAHVIQKFDLLDVGKTAKLLDKLGKKKDSGSLSLADIFNTPAGDVTPPKEKFGF